MSAGADQRLMDALQEYISDQEPGRLLTDYVVGYTTVAQHEDHMCYASGFLSRHGASPMTVLGLAQLVVRAADDMVFGDEDD